MGNPGKSIKEETMDKQEAMFSAVLPSIATAIRIHGDSGMRIQLDIDDSYVAEVLKLVAWRECELEVTVRPVPK